MKGGSRLRAHVALFLWLVVLVGMVHSASKPRYLQQRRASQAEAFHRGVRDKAEKFNSYRYITGEGLMLGRLLAEKLDTKSLQLSDRQLEKLKSRLPEVFSYLGNPSFEKYHQLKADGFKVQVQLSPKTESFLKKSGVTVGEVQGAEVARTLKCLWDRLKGTNHIENARLTGLCLENFKARVSHTNSHPSILGNNTGAGITAVDEVFEPGFRYAGQTNAVSYEHSSGLFFHLSFLARSNSSTDAGPMFVSLYWSEPDENWAPSRLFVDQLLKFNVWF